ncbi:hypothetical protein HY463_00945 [Candidatus Peregrinibacteria bacterium]|nr:hypothetical protein [Candidatus Peregrinibacteria bacterium]
MILILRIILIEVDLIIIPITAGQDDLLTMLIYKFDSHLSEIKRIGLHFSILPSGLSRAQT